MGRPKLSNRNTKAELIQAARIIIQTKGFHAFTFQDLADKLKIRKPSIYHYFPTKADLGVDILEDGVVWFNCWCQELKAKNPSPLKKIEAYLKFFHYLSGDGKRVCPGGAFMIIWPILPGKLQKAVKKIIAVQIEWLKETLEQGRKSGEITEKGGPEEQAQMILASLQGGLQTSRAQGDPTYFRYITKQLFNSLKKS